MFQRLEQAAVQAERAPVRVTVDGGEVRCREGDSVAAALLASGHFDCRDTVVQGVPRGPFCMMGVCYDCLVTIDGIANRQACMTPVHAGMRIERQRGAPEVQP
ncbi:(2Fe-2S)-binding protein [Orrella sp. JC864]|uniref:(2Fe-2S)-binding protein n=1 Tax=Orrella sp. JC864 TaxID=3120298 RepID=UPI00300BAFF5